MAGPSTVRPGEGPTNRRMALQDLVESPERARVQYRSNLALACSRLAKRIEACCVRGAELMVDGIRLIPRGPRNEVEPGDSHGETRSGVDIGLEDVWSNHGKAEPGVGGLAGVWVEDMLTLLIRARCGDRQTTGQDDPGDLCPLDGVSYADPPGAALGVTATSLDIAACVNEIVAVATAVKN